jgi:hypothetical protein
MNRCCLEVLKFTSAEDILRHVSCTSRLWYKVSNENELWHELLDYESLPSLGPKETYRQSRKLVLAKLERGKLILCHCALGTTEAVELKGTHSFSWNSAHAFLDSLRVLTCGSQLSGFSSEAFIVHIKTGECVQVESMTTERVGHGLIVVKSTAYVFGGYGPLASCETWREGQCWRRLSKEMGSVRAWFTPCAANDMIYLCGGGRGPCEKFIINSESFEELAITMPVDYVSSCSVNYKNCILILTSAHIAVYNQASGLSYITSCNPGKDMWSNSPAVVYKNTVILERDEEENRVVVLEPLLEDPSFVLVLS